MQPVRASSEYTVPFWLPTNTRPPATLGCAHADEASGNPNAHLSAKRGTCSAVRPACAADWKRAFVIVGPHPFHIGPDDEIRNGDAAVQRPAAAPVTSPPRVLPVMYSAIARRPGPPSREPCTPIPPRVTL